VSKSLTSSLSIREIHSQFDANPEISCINILIIEDQVTSVGT
jgi:hypothetical protein